MLIKHIFSSVGESQLHLSSVAASSSVKHTASPLNRAAISIYFEIWSFASPRNLWGSGRVRVSPHWSLVYNLWTKRNEKHVTTYQHTLAEGNSTPADAPLNTPPSRDPPDGTPGNRRRLERPPRRTADPCVYWKGGHRGLRRAPGRILRGTEYGSIENNGIM